MDDDARMQRLEAALKSFETEIDRLKAEHSAKIHAILTEIHDEKLAMMKKELEKHAG